MPKIVKKERECFVLDLPTLRANYSLCTYLAKQGCWVFNCAVQTRLTRDSLHIATGEIVFRGHHDLILRSHLLTSDELSIL
jgi:hypothetical protein